MNAVSLRFVGRSEIGNVRKNNEDSGYASTNLLVVADGMGGHSAGELASAATVAAVVSARDNSTEDDDLLELLATAVITSGEYIADVVAGNRELTGMGTTLTAIALDGDRIAMAHVGDSRAYLMRDNELLQITKDHTYVQSLVDSGQITELEALNHPRRNLLMRAIDGIHAVEPDLSVREAHVGDRYLICSDGLSAVVSQEQIAVAMQQSDPTQTVTELIDLAISAGAPDNVTVIVADVITDGLPVDPVLIGAAIETDTQTRLPAIDFPEELAATEQSAEALISETKTKGTFLKPVLITLLTLIGILGASYWWLANQWYLAEYRPNQVVAIYRGIPTAGLSKLVEVSDVKVNTLPEFEKQQIINTVDVATYAEAKSGLERLRERVLVCLQDPTTPSCEQTTK